MSSTKKIINSVENVVDDAIEGLLQIDNFITMVENAKNVIVRRDINEIKQNYVTLISGGGSGHEPAHAGFIGQGMLSAAVLGNVFASPSVTQILAAIRVCAGPKGCLLIVKNYTGDRLNFGMAMERAKGEGLLVEMVIVSDDSALPEGKGITGGRGVAGTLFVHKIAGATAADGASLDVVLKAAVQASENVRSLGVALTTCTVPGAPASDRLADSDTWEVGLGIHGEPGREQRTVDDLGGRMAEEVAQVMVKEVYSRLETCISQTDTREVAVMLNNLGALPLLELLVVQKEVVKALTGAGIQCRPVRVMAGTFMTSLEMAGVSLSVLSLQDASMLVALDAHTTAPAWVAPTPLVLGVNGCAQAAVKVPYTPKDSTILRVIGGWDAHGLGEDVRGAIGAACDRLIEVEPELTRCDTICGDGDCGLVIKKGAIAVQALLQSEEGKGITSPAALCDAMAEAVSGSMGGTSGALIELCLRSMANHYRARGADAIRPTAAFAGAVGAGVDAMMFYGGAVGGMRTMLDALLPVVKTLQQFSDQDSVSSILRAAAAAAAQGAGTTARMEALAGRANYVNTDLMMGVEDPGASAVKEAFAAAAGFYK